MNQVQISQIKEISTKISPEKIKTYLTKNPKSRTLKLLRNYSKRISKSKDEKEIARLGAKTAYFLNTIVKANYVSEQNEKNLWLEISQQLFKNTVGLLKRVKVLFCNCNETLKRMTTGIFGSTGGKEAILLKRTEVNGKKRKVYGVEKWKCLECSKETLLVDTCEKV